MKKLNFKEMEISTCISGNSKIVIDASELFADIVYTKANGIKMHSLSLKIYNSDNDTEYTEEEINDILNIASSHTTPAFIDGIKMQLNNSN